MSRPKLGYLLFDLPSDHEVEGALATECQTIEAIITNRGMPSRVKRICVTSRERFLSYPTYRYQAQFVHLACHGETDGIGLLGGDVKWRNVADQVTRHLKPLHPSGQRVMCFSCCFSNNGYKATRRKLRGYFSGAYYFTRDKVGFSESLTIWSMFYLRKGLSRPHQAIVKDINRFLGEEVIAFASY